MWELSTETNRIETVVVRYGVATIFATVIFRRNLCRRDDAIDHVRSDYGNIFSIGSSFENLIVPRMRR